MRLCMGCNRDLTGTYATRLYCDPCGQKRARQKTNAAKRLKRRASGAPLRRGGAPSKSKHCRECERMPHRRPAGGVCPECGGAWAAEIVACQAPTGGAWVWL